MIRKAKFSTEQLEAARSLLREGKSWYGVARVLGTNYEAIRSQLDPVYEAQRQAWYQRRSDERKRLSAELGAAANKIARPSVKGSKPSKDAVAGDETLQARRKAVAEDHAFVAAMQSAIRSRAENPSIGVDTRPGTYEPHFMPARSLSNGSAGSPAGQCADWA